MPARPADARWEARCARARQLARERSASREALEFYASLAMVQRSLPHRHAGALDAAPELVVWLQRHAPGPLALAARELRKASTETWQGLVDRVAFGFSPARAELKLGATDGGAELKRGATDGGAELKLGATDAGAELKFGATDVGAELKFGAMDVRDGSVDVDELRTFIVEALLQPFANEGCSHGGPPVAATLREEAHGARRSYVCGLCLTESPAPRLGCLACGEARFDALPVFRADETDPARVDACDTCRVYLKTIDLTRDGAACPIVDDLASLPLDLWAREQGYRRLRPNLLRL